MSFITVVLLFSILTLSFAKEYENKLDRCIIPCRSTDFTCFKMQYQMYRDCVLLGCRQLDVPNYQPYTVQYADSATCVNMSGVEESEMVAISFDGSHKKFTITLEMPVRIEQIDWKDKTDSCAQPDREFTPTGLHKGPLRKFSGNATVEITFTYKLQKKKGEIYMLLEDEDIEVILDIPEFSQYDRDSELETKVYECSEWAYDVVQHVDVAEHSVVPHTEQMKKLFMKLPLERFILLYPTEAFTDLQFKYSNDNIPQ